MSFFFRWPLAKAFKNAGGDWDESKVVRGKTTAESTEGSFAPKGGEGDTAASPRQTATTHDAFVMAGYADANESDRDAGMKNRELIFLSGHEQRIEDWEGTMKRAVPGGYNAFSVRRIANAMRKVEGGLEAPYRFSIRTGREYSPVLFVDVTDHQGNPAPTKQRLAGLNALIKAKGRLRADEVSYEAKGYEGTGKKFFAKGPNVRLWWD